MFEIDRINKTAKSIKTTFKNTSPLLPLLEHYVKIMAAINKLIKRKTSFAISIAEIKEICSKMPKSL